jgi:alkane 1-monooxygenase
MSSDADMGHVSADAVAHRHGARSIAPFLLPYGVAMIVLGASWSGAAWAFQFVSWVFLAALLADSIGARSGRDVRPDFVPNGKTARMLTWPWLFVQAALILTGLLSVLRAPETFSATCIAVGATGGMFGIPVAHELMHRRGALDRLLARALMTLFSYTHFCIEHVEGHHRNVATPADPATARLGEGLYAFLPRTVFGGWVDAWRIEAERLRKARRAPISPFNRMVWCSIGVAAVYATVAVMFGRLGVFFFAAQGMIAVFLIETLNYIEHYGLVRRTAGGHLEAVTYHHSWDASHPVSGWLLFNVTRHADHHMHPQKDYLSLEVRSEAPQLPAGYFSLFVLALFPPLWRKVIDPRLHDGGTDETVDSRSD